MDHAGREEVLIFECRSRCIFEHASLGGRTFVLSKQFPMAFALSYVGRHSSKMFLLPYRVQIFFRTLRIQMPLHRIVRFPFVHSYIFSPIFIEASRGSGISYRYGGVTLTRENT